MRLLRSARVTVRRVARHPFVARATRSGALLRKHVIRATTLSFVPNTVNDVIFHHASLNLGEILHVTQDTITVGTINAAVSLLTLASKCI